MNDFNIMYGFVVGIIFGIGIYMGSQGIRGQHKNQSIDLLTLNYSKDKKGNCFAYEAYSQKFTWIPCELADIGSK